MTRTNVVPPAGTVQGFSCQDSAAPAPAGLWSDRPLGTEYAKPVPTSEAGPGVDRLAVLAGVLHFSGQMYLDQQRDEVERQSRALDQALKNFQDDLGCAHILPADDWEDSRRHAWLGLISALRSAGLPPIVLDTALAMDRTVRP